MATLYSLEELGDDFELELEPIPGSSSFSLPDPTPVKTEVAPPNYCYCCGIHLGKASNIYPNLSTFRSYQVKRTGRFYIIGACDPCNRRFYPAISNS